MDREVVFYVQIAIALSPAWVAIGYWVGLTMRERARRWAVRRAGCSRCAKKFQGGRIG